jgi:fructosamine-3-kinase
MGSLQDIFHDCGLKVQRYEIVHGGDINDAYCLITQQGKYFLKKNNKDKYPLMFEKEAHGLELLRSNSSFVIPQVIRTSVYEDQQYLLLEWLEKGPPKTDMWEGFGGALAGMHKPPQDYFGSGENNYIGSLEQVNNMHTHWHSFYAECRIMPLVRLLMDAGLCTAKEVGAAEALCSQFEQLFPAEPAALLHGDLWAGNYFIHSSGHAAIFDPAVYFGNREMDIGMTKLFGGFDQRFYDAYNHYYPLQTGWQNRLPLTQLYPLLVHAVLFRGHYIASAFNIIDRFA